MALRLRIPITWLTSSALPNLTTVQCLTPLAGWMHTIYSQDAHHIQHALVTSSTPAHHFHEVGKSSTFLAELPLAVLLVILSFHALVLADAGRSQHPRQLHITCLARSPRASTVQQSTVQWGPLPRTTPAAPGCHLSLLLHQ